MSPAGRAIPSARRLRRAAIARMRRGDLGLPVRQVYLDLFAGQEANLDNIARVSKWLIYVYYVAMIRELIADDGARIIDWGGQTGHVAQLLREAGFTNAWNYLHYQDPAVNWFQPAHYAPIEARFALPTIVAPEPMRLALEDASVDVGISSGVLEHVRDDGVGTEAGALAEWYRALRPGGWLFVWAFPARWGSAELLATALGRWHHAHRYTGRQVRALFDTAGFAIEYCDKHRLIPGSLQERLGRVLGRVRTMVWDDRIARRWPLRVWANDWAVIARKPGA